MNLISGKGETSSRLPAFSLFLPGSRPNNRYRRISSFCPTSWTWPKKCRLSSGKFSENPSPRTGCVWAHQNEWSIGWVGAGGRGGCFRVFADTIFNSRRETRAPLVDNIAHARAKFIEVQAHRGCKLSIDTLLLVLELLLDVRCPQRRLSRGGVPDCTELATACRNCEVISLKNPFCYIR